MSEVSGDLGDKARGLTLKNPTARQPIVYVYHLVDHEPWFFFLLLTKSLRWKTAPSEQRCDRDLVVGPRRRMEMQV